MILIILRVCHVSFDTSTAFFSGVSFGSLKWLVEIHVCITDINYMFIRVVILIQNIEVSSSKSYLVCGYITLNSCDDPKLFSFLFAGQGDPFFFWKSNIK